MKTPEQHYARAEEMLTAAEKIGADMEQQAHMPAAQATAGFMHMQTLAAVAQAHIALGEAKARA